MNAKRIAVAAIAAVLMLSMVACGAQESTDVTTITTTATTRGGLVGVIPPTEDPVVETPDVDEPEEDVTNPIIESIKGDSEPDEDPFYEGEPDVDTEDKWGTII